MPSNNKKPLLMLSLSLGALLASGSALAGLQAFQDESSNNYSCGYKNDKGQIVVAAKYEGCGDFSEGLARVSIIKPIMKDGYEDGIYLQGYINETGKLVIPIKYEAPLFDGVFIDYRDFHQGLLAVYKNGKYGYMNISEKLMIPYQYDTAGDFDNGLAVVSRNEKHGVIDRNGKTVVPLTFDWLGGYSEGLAQYRVGGWEEGSKSGFIDQSGKIAIPAKWDEAMEFSEGLAAVKVGNYDTGKWGVIDKSGKQIVTPKYDMAYIELMGDTFDVDGGRYEDGKLEVYNLNKAGAGPYMSYGSITRYILNRQGKIIEQKTFADWEEIQKVRNPEYYE